MRESSSRFLTKLLAASLAILPAGCGTEPPPPPGLPATLLVASGDLQVSAPGGQLPDRIRIRVVDSAENPVPGVRIILETPDGDGTVIPTESQTNEVGEVAAEWTLRSTVGMNRLQISVPSSNLHTTAIAVGAISPVTVSVGNDSILYGGRFHMGRLTVDTSALIAIRHEGRTYFYYAGLGPVPGPLSEALSVMSVRRRLAAITEEGGEASFARQRVGQADAQLAGVEISATSEHHFFFQNARRRLVGLKFSSVGGQVGKIFLPPRGDLVALSLTNLWTNTGPAVTFLERPTYSRVITESTECEAFGSVVRLPLLPHSFIEDLWLALRPELRDALASDGLWLGTVNVADAVQLYLGITGDIAPLILDVGIPCLGNFLAAGLDILSFKLTDRLATAEGVEEVVGASRALLDEVGLEMTGCFCEAGLPVICEVVSKAVEIFRLGVRAIDDGVFRPFDILRTPIYARTTLGPSNLTVTLAAEPAAGHAPLEGVDLRAETHGEASGTINFTFYCDRADAGIDVTPGWAAKFDQVSQTSLTAVDACAYASPGLYTAKVIVERGTSAAEARTEMAVTGGGERIEHVSGGGQTGVPGSALPQPIVVQALDENGLPLPNVEVTFLVTEGGGSVEPGTALTDASGLAQTSWTLGPAPGLNALQASAPSLGSSLTLSATGVPDDGWEFAPQSSGERFHSSPAIASDGIIFIPTTNTSVLDHGRLYAIRPDGQPLWTDPFPVGGDQTPAISEEDELVHVGEDEKLYVIDRASGTELCRVPLDGFSATSPALNGDTAYIATGQLGGTVFAVKISRPCGVLWEFERPAIGLGFQSPPAVADDGSIYAASWETDSTYSLNPDGSLRWGFQAQEFFLSSPAIAGDILYIGGGTTFYALDRITGQPRWTRVLGGDVNSSPALGSDGKVFVGADDGRLYGFTSSGEPVWPPGNSWDPPNRSSAAVGSDGNIYFAPTDAEIVGVSPLNGEVVWSYPTGGGAGSSNSSSPSLAGGRVYIGRGNIFFAIPAPASGLATSSWPKFRHDLRNTGRAGAPLAGIRVSRD